MQHIGDLLPRQKKPAPQYNADFFLNALPELHDLEVPVTWIEQNRLLLVEYIRQRSICNACQGFERCGKEGDMKGFAQRLEPYANTLTVTVEHCGPFLDYSGRQRANRFAKLSGGLEQDGHYQFDNFPMEQRTKYPRLWAFAHEFADDFEPGQAGKGLYLFGPPGVGKTHLMLAVLNRLRDRGISCLFVRSDSMFDRMRHIIADNGDLEPMLEAYATVPVLGIDEFAQERANEFTLEKLFRIVNHRFHAQLPTWFTSNYPPPNIYRKNGQDLLDVAGPLRSRIMQMAYMAKIDGDDARQRNIETLT